MATILKNAVQASSLGQSAADAFDAELKARGILPACKRIREWTGTALRGSSLSLAHSFVASGRGPMPLPEGAPYAPGAFQIHVPLDPGTGRLKVDMANVNASLGSFGGGGFGNPYAPAVLVAFGSDPIRFSYEPVLSSTAGDPVGMAQSSGRYSAEVDVPADATDAHVMIVNMGDQDGLYTDVRFTTSAAPPDAGVGGSGNVAGAAGASGSGDGSGGTNAANPAGDDVEPAGGCGCRTVSGRTTHSSVLLALALALAAARRRRTG